jgi:hypothetical protein
MVVWGGYYVDASAHCLNTGARYNPVADSWTPTSDVNAPESRLWHSAVWTGNEMIVWGGSGSSELNTGGRYSPAGNLSEGTHSFAVRAYDAALNVDPTAATYSWTIDLTAPITSLASVPTDPASSPDAVFEFKCNETDCTYECNLGSEGWQTCTTPVTYNSLLEGPHDFQVRATDAAGNVDPIPVNYSWDLDLTAPDTFISSSPVDPNNLTSAQFNFTCTETGCTFECSLDSAGWEPCTAPVTYNLLLRQIMSIPRPLFLIGRLI